MRKSRSQRAARRRMLALFLGGGLLLALVLGGLFVWRHTQVPAPRPALTTQAGPYTLAFFITPNPPLTNQVTHLAIHVTETTTGQPVKDVGIELQGLMTSMDMGMGPFFATSQQNGTYLVDVPLYMGGLWQFTITITSYSAPTVSTLLKLTSH